MVVGKSTQASMEVYGSLWTTQRCKIHLYGRLWISVNFALCLSRSASSCIHDDDDDDDDDDGNGDDDECVSKPRGGQRRSTEVIGGEYDDDGDGDDDVHPAVNRGQRR